MCGLAGIWDSSDGERTVRAMMAALAHRGPDAAGVHSGGSGMLGHRRLSIMDPAGGDQPLYSRHGRRAIIANGEIYNHPALRDELGARYPYRTGSDTESALHLYDAMGEAMAARLDGMFALAIADGAELFLARDPIGIKPLYYGYRRDDGGGRALVFASELKALAGHAEDVQEFPPGTWYHSRHGFRRYFEVPVETPRERPPEAHARILRETLERSVVKRLMSDVPLGAFLSGGLDSSLVAALARRHVDTLHTFSVGVAGSEDLEAARIVARHLDTVHHEVVITPEDVRAHLPAILYALESFDPDSVRSAVPCYFVSRLAAGHVKVILTGEGADELFAGYRYYKDIADPEALHRELRRSVASMHDINLQRVDRLTMAHSIEGRVPFLDVDMIALAQTIPAGLKLRPRPADGRPVEKWILRKAGEGLLPEEILWRDKVQFDEGSGAAEVLQAGVDHWLPPGDVPGYRARHAEAALRSHEECVYHKLLTEAFGEARTLVGNVSRWAERPV